MATTSTMSVSPNQSYSSVNRLTKKKIYKGAYECPSSLGASIPSKYQTFFKCSTESKGFNSCSTRLFSLNDADCDHPGPGHYSINQSPSFHQSLSKKGTCGFPSKTHRFSRRIEGKVGPGSYNPLIQSPREDFNRTSFTRNFHQPVAVSTSKHGHHPIPAPNTYTIKETQTHRDTAITGESVFNSRTKRQGVLVKSLTTPGPGHYNPSDHTSCRASYSQKANFRSKTIRQSFPFSQDDTPGPAHYYKEENYSGRDNHGQRRRHYLCISAPAIPLPPIPPSPGPGHYEVSCYDNLPQMVCGAVFKSTSSRLDAFNIKDTLHIGPVPQL